MPHEELIHPMGGAAAFRDGPDDQGLSAAHVAGSEYLGTRRTIIEDGCLHIAARIEIDTQCAGASGYSGLIFNEEVCAGNWTSGGVDTCQGDSGGPMFKRNALNEWVQVGITSWGTPSAAAASSVPLPP